MLSSLYGRNSPSPTQLKVNMGGQLFLILDLCLVSKKYGREPYLYKTSYLVSKVMGGHFLKFFCLFFVLWVKIKKGWTFFKNIHVYCILWRERAEGDLFKHIFQGLRLKWDIRNNVEKARPETWPEELQIKNVLGQIKDDVWPRFLADSEGSFRCQRQKVTIPPGTSRIVVYDWWLMKNPCFAWIRHPLYNGVTALPQFEEARYYILFWVLLESKSDVIRDLTYPFHVSGPINRAYIGRWTRPYCFELCN